MQTSFEFDGQSPDDLLEAFGRLSAVLADELERAALDIGLRYGGEAARNAPKDRGRLSSDLVEPVVERVGEALIKVRVGSNTDQARPQEFGTDPFFPPPSELRGWAGRVLGDEDAAFVVARSISETGLEAQEFLKGSFANESNLVFAVNRINEAIENAFSEVGFDI